MKNETQHRRLQHEVAASAAATLHSALTHLNRGGVCKEPLTPGMFVRPNLKGLQAVLHLLYSRIRGAARSKKVRSLASLSTLLLALNFQPSACPLSQHL
jgi:hypothetical protein